jgi:FOG: CheY-like receiver
MGGEAFIKKIREVDETVKIIVSTADVQKTVKEEIESLQVTAFLNKPIKKEMIFLTLSEMKGK